MSILIKDMEMPTGCAFCRIGKRSGKKMVCPLCDEEWDIHDTMSADHRLDNCPLVPVPSHGRLLNVLKTERECVSRDCDRNCGKCELSLEQSEILSAYDTLISMLSDPAEEKRKEEGEAK